jgi:Ca2+-binding RTX toxin-like protein
VAISGTLGNDTLNGGPDIDVLYGLGGDGDDRLHGDEGNDSISGGAGSDDLTGGAGDDTLSGGVGSDQFYVWNGIADTSVDTIADFITGLGGDRLSISTWGWTSYTIGDNPFVSGHVRLTQAGANTLLEVDSDGSGSVATFRTVAILNNVTKSNPVAYNLDGFDPSAIGGTAADHSLIGGAGNDQIYGLDGNDTVNGLAGDDRLDGGAGNDVLNGGDGNDLLEGGTSYDVLIGGAGNATLDGGLGIDIVIQRHLIQAALEHLQKLPEIVRGLFGIRIALANQEQNVFIS